MTERKQRHLNQNSSGTNETLAEQTSRRMKISICPTTGGRMDLMVSERETVNGLKWLISRSLRIPPEKMTLLYKNRPLDGGRLQCHQVSSGSRITLLPNMESGLSLQKSEVGVIQALENLSDAQVSDFLSGKAPLLLAMRLGDHMMFVQLQLSTAPCATRRGRNLPSPTPQGMATAPTPVTTSPGLPPAMSSTTVVNSTVTGTSSPQGPPLSPTSLTRASRNLSQKLKELSRITSVNPKCSNEVCRSSTGEKDSGAIIESMHHHGKGVYSGTFSGTLDPTLQDRDGKPKRDISTIIHILNDLLGANPPVHPAPGGAAGGPAGSALQQPQPSLSSPVINNFQGNNSPPTETDSGWTEEEALRGKLQHLQQMMEEKRIRRQARRHLKSPYQWHGLRRETPAPKVGLQSGSSALGSRVNPSPVEAMKPVGMEVGEKVSESSYNSSAPMEHETLAV